MSGGHYNYYQQRIEDIIESIEDAIENNRKPVENKGEYYNDDWHHDFSDEVIMKFKEGIEALKKAYVYAQRIDLLLSGDDSKESFLRRLEEDLEELNYKL